VKLKIEPSPFQATIMNNKKEYLVEYKYEELKLLPKK